MSIYKNNPEGYLSILHNSVYVRRVNSNTIQQDMVLLVKSIDRGWRSAYVSENFRVIDYDTWEIIRFTEIDEMWSIETDVDLGI